MFFGLVERGWSRQTTVPARQTPRNNSSRRGQQFSEQTSNPGSTKQDKNNWRTGGAASSPCGWIPNRGDGNTILGGDSGTRAAERAPRVGEASKRGSDDAWDWMGILVGLLPSSRGFLVFFMLKNRGRKEKVCVAVAARDKQTDAVTKMWRRAAVWLPWYVAKWY
jgi:hypothetical protein